VGAAEQALAEGLGKVANHPVLAALHGRLLELKGETEAAAGAYRQALAGDLLDLDARVEALTGLGGALSAIGECDEARSRFEQALAVDDDALLARLGLAELLLVQDAAADAARHFAKAASLLDPREAGPLLHRVATQLALLGLHAEAEEALRRLIAVQPDNLPALSQLGRVLRSLQREEESIAVFRQAVQAAPDDIGAMCDLGRALMQRAPDEAETLLDRAVALAPDDVRTLFARGSYAEHHGDADRACTLLSEALQRYEQDGPKGDVQPALICNNLANALIALGRRRDGLAMFEQAVAYEPASRTYRHNRGLCLLGLAEWERGWTDYEERLHLSRKLGTGLPDFAAWGTSLPPLWDDEPLDGRQVVVICEQGPGDMVMFAQCLPALVQTGADVELRAPQRMAAILERSFPDVRVSVYPTIEHSAAAPSSADYAIPLGSLPRRYRRHNDDFTAPDRYLAVDPGAAEAWRERLDALGEGLKVGISWRGGGVSKELAFRRVPLMDWAGLAELPGIHLVSLQYGERRAELDALAEATGARIADWEDLDPVFGIDDFAALVDGLDLVISVANTTVHFAAALGKPVWSLVPTAASWRWLTERTDSPWYPTMTLLRQARGQPWSDLLRETEQRLAAFRNAEG
ncbi:MAG: tetratricopeptide repeat protein, partial [Alphaproteobacteria bacterium]|nr:tetratricopeptide repeat protein [Alphaproteobacteria bacterium]